MRAASSPAIRPDPSTRARVPAEAAGRLMLMRIALIVLEAGGLLLAVWLLGARLPWPPLLGIVGLHALLLGWAAWQHRVGAAPSTQAAALELATDAALLAAVVYFTGGYANPFISLMLAPLILGAVLLSAWLAWALAAWVGVLYTLLMQYYQPLGLTVSDSQAVHMHLLGMWLNFLLTAALVAALTGALAAALRRRDAELAAAREARLRDEHLFALGVQAASAAHDMATPLASVRLTLDDLAADYAGDDELEPRLGLISAQLRRVEAVLARLGEVARARQGRADAPATPLREWLDDALTHWGLLHPHARISLETADDTPSITPDHTLESVLMSLLNNAVAASPEAVAVSAEMLHDSGPAATLRIRVRDSGPGLGHTPEGWGVGLSLARASLARMGGRLEVSDRREGGVCADILLPVGNA